jgi:hypothetical protein
MKTAAIALLLLAIALPASAEIYKCRLPNGKTEIANVPCPSGSGTITVRPDEPVPEASRQQAERDVERMRGYVEKREAAQRAEVAAERQERASQQQSSSPSRTPRNYGSAEECLRDIGQMALEATQRAQMEAECRNIVRPQTVYVPVAVPVYPQRTHIHPPPAPKAAPPSAPKISMPPPKN